MRLPAFGKAFLEERRSGRHPATVGIVYAPSWSGVDTSPHPRLALKPEEYAPRRFDWGLVAGLWVIVYDWAGGAFECEPEANRFGVFYDLVAELAATPAFVELRWPAQTWVSRHADLLAWEQRRAVKGRFEWPRWWSEQQQRTQEARFAAWVQWRSEVALEQRRAA